MKESAKIAWTVAVIAWLSGSAGVLLAMHFGGQLSFLPSFSEVSSSHLLTGTIENGSSEASYRSGLNDILPVWFSHWPLSQKLAAFAVLAGMAQFIALMITIGVMISSSHRQLRAYVFVENAWANYHVGRRAWHVRYRLKNAGTTPAYRMRVFDIAKLVDWPLSRLPAPTASDYFGTVAPNGDFIDCESNDVPGYDLDQIHDESKAVILVGKITYRDAFRKTRTSYFCFYATGHIRADGEMSVHDEGNDST